MLQPLEQDSFPARQGDMSQITEVLLFGPPCLAVVTWAFARGWSRAMQGGQISERFQRWERYDFWVILAIMYLVMFGTAIAEHKL